MKEADLILHHGKVYTVDEQMQMAEALAVVDGKIAAVGSNEEILGMYMAEQSFDLEGKPVYPGFYDPHCHFYWLGTTMMQSDLTGSESYEAAIEQLEAFHKTHPDLAWLQGGGWDQNNWKAQSFPTKELLDEKFPGIPVYLTRVDGHAALVNQKALDLAGVDETSSVHGGDLLKNVGGKLTGILIDNAMNLVSDIIPESTNAEKLSALQQAEKACFANGLTSLADAVLGKEMIQLIEDAQAKGELKIRTYIMAKPEDRTYWYERGQTGQW